VSFRVALIEVSLIKRLDSSDGAICCDHNCSYRRDHRNCV